MARRLLLFFVVVITLAAATAAMADEVIYSYRNENGCTVVLTDTGYLMARHGEPLANGEWSRPGTIWTNLGHPVNDVGHEGRATGAARIVYEHNIIQPTTVVVTVLGYFLTHYGEIVGTHDGYCGFSGSGPEGWSVAEPIWPDPVKQEVMAFGAVKALFQ